MWVPKKFKSNKNRRSKKFLSPNKFWLKRVSSFGLKNFLSKNFMTKIVRAKKNLVKQNLSPKKFQVQNILGPKCFGSKNICGWYKNIWPNTFRSKRKKNLVQTNFWSEQIFSKRKWVKRSFEPQKLRPPKNG